MLSSNTYVIRLATDADRDAVTALARLDGQPVLREPILVGEVAGSPVAALSMADDRLVADPFQPSLHIAAHLRVRAEALTARERTPSLPTRLRAAVVVRRPRVA
jgi:hypothetical protein